MLKILMLFITTLFCDSLKLVKPNIYLKYADIRPFYNNLYSINKNHKNYSLEHIIPQSVFKSKNSILKKDMHNIILYHCKLNLHRSNYKFTSDSNIYPKSRIMNDKGEELIYSGKLESDFCIKTNKYKIFHPNDKYKGTIARSSMYFLTTYPEYKDIILSNIIDPFTILTWHHQFPVCEFEMLKNSLIKEIQENENIYVSYPDKLVVDMEDIIDEDLGIFKNYKY